MLICFVLGSTKWTTALLNRDPAVLCLTLSQIAGLAALTKPSVLTPQWHGIRHLVPSLIVSATTTYPKEDTTLV